MSPFCCIGGGGGGVLDLSLGRGMPPGPWNPDPVYDKKFVKILKNWYPVYDFQVKFHSFFRHNAWFLGPVDKESSKILEFDTLFMSGRSKNHTLKGGTSPYSLCMGEIPPPLPGVASSCCYKTNSRSLLPLTALINYRFGILLSM